MDRELTPTQKYQFGDFQIDITDDTLYHGGEKLNINRRTFGVLRLLVERAGHIVSKQEFFDTVWADTFVEDNSLTVAMSTLRKLLGEDAKQPSFIENLPRKGYRFIGKVRVVERQIPVSQSEEMLASAEKAVSEDNAGNRYGARVKTRKYVLGVVSACLIIFAGLSLKYYSITQFSFLKGKQDHIDSVAVLPFYNADPETAYISDGLSESVINNLMSLANLRVIGRNSVFKYKNAEIDLQTVRDDLNVKAVLTGTVTQLDGNLVITAELIDLESNSQIWTGRYARKQADLLAMQRELSRDVSEQFRSEMPAGVQRGVPNGETDSPEAYQLYLKGHYAWNKRTEEGFRRGVDYFREAIDLDPGYARAYAGLATCYLQGDFDYIDSNEERMGMVLGATKKALEINPQLSEAYATQGLMKANYGWDWSGAESDYQLTIKLNPNYATAHHWYAELLAIEGRFDESIAEYEKAVELDPLSLAIKSDLGITYYYAGQYDRALEYLQRLQRIDPAHPRTYSYLAEVYMGMGMYEKAIEAYEQSWAHGSDDFPKRSKDAARLRSGLRSSGSNGFWRTLLQIHMERVSRVEGATPGFLGAQYHARLGESDKAFELLEEAFSRHETNLVYMKVKREFDDIRTDARFVDLLQRVGLPQ